MPLLWLAREFDKCVVGEGAGSRCILAYSERKVNMGRARNW